MNGEEVDVVIERGRSLVVIEVKATREPGYADARRLPPFRGEYGNPVNGCLLLHAGNGRF